MNVIGKWRLLGLGLVAVAAAGCSTMLKVGHDFQYGDFAARAVQGQTTKAEVEDWLGPPEGRGMVLETDGSKNDQWTYYFGSGRFPSGDDTKFKLLQVKFDAQGKLISYVWSGEPAQKEKDQKE